MATRKAAVIRIDAARRRLRPELRSSPSDSPPTSRRFVTLALLSAPAVIVALLVITKLVFERFNSGGAETITAAVLLVALIGIGSVVTLILMRRGAGRPPRKPIVRIDKTQVRRRSEA